jgi:hypothetical protein
MQCVADGLNELFRGFTLAPHPASIVPKSSKRRDLVGNTAMLDPLLYQPVDLDHPVATAVEDVIDVTYYRYGDRDKGLLIAVRGDGGGKTRALVAMKDALLKCGDVHPILITFTSKWPTDDFARFTRAYRRPGLVVAPVVIARMAAVSFDVDMDVITTMLQTADLKFLTSEWRWRHAVAAFGMLLAERAGRKRVILLVDDVTHAMEALASVFPKESKRTDAAEHIRNAFLYQDFQKYGFSSALVVSGLDTSVSAGTISNHVIHSLELPEQLNATEVVNRLFLMDADEDGTLHRVTPTLAGSTQLAHQALTVLAAAFCQHPRGLQCVQDELRARVDRTVPHVRKLPLTPASLRDVFRAALSQFEDCYPGQKFPQPDLLCDVLFHERCTPMDDRVIEGVRRSVFVNTLSIRHCKTYVNENRTINLRSSLVSLFTAVQHTKEKQQVEVKPVSVEDCIEKLVMCVDNWATQVDAVGAASIALKATSFAWLRLLLFAAARAKRPIDLQSILQLNSLHPGKNGAISPQVLDYLDETIPLPKTKAILLHALQEICFAPQDVAAVHNGALNAVTELDKICLSEECPIVMLQAAPGDNWDFCLAYLGSAKRGQRAVRVVLFRCEVPQGPVRNKTTVTSCAAIDYATDTAAEGRTQLLHQRVMTAVEGWHKGKQLRSVGRCIRDQQHLFVHITTQPGDSTADGNVVHMRGRDTGPFFNFMYPIYEALQAATGSVAATISAVQDARGVL